MSLNPKILESIELDLLRAQGNVAAGLIDPSVSADAKLIASAIEKAGAQIALAINAAAGG